jgi:glycosyltransferase involved in cell wall biosynthesis
VAEAAGILYVTTSNDIGGGTRVLMNIMQRLPHRYRPVVVAPSEGAVTRWAQEAGIPCRIVPSSVGGQAAGRLATLQQSAALVPIILSEAIRVVHAEAPVSYRPAGLAGALTRRPRVCHLGFPPEPGELEWCFRSGPEAVIACYDGQARDVQHEVARVAPGAQVISVPNGIDVGRFSPRKEAGDAWLRWRFGARHVVLIIGHLSRVKGYPAFLQAAATIARSIDDCAFVCVGGETVQPGYGAELKQLADRLGIGARVHFIGWQDDIVPVLQAADVMALPSLDEGLPMAIIEAMATAVPVVSTPVGGVPDAVVEGETGFMVPPENPQALAEAVSRLLRDESLARQMGAAGRRRAEQLFTLDRCAREMTDVYDRLLDGRHGVDRHDRAGAAVLR